MAFINSNKNCQQRQIREHKVCIKQVKSVNQISCFQTIVKYHKLAVSQVTYYLWSNLCPIIYNIKSSSPLPSNLLVIQTFLIALLISYLKDICLHFKLWLIFFQDGFWNLKTMLKQQSTGHVENLIFVFWGFFYFEIFFWFLAIFIAQTKLHFLLCS